MTLCASSSPAAKRRQSSCSSRSATRELGDVELSRTRSSGVVSPTQDNSLAFNQSSADRPISSINPRSTSEQSSKDLSMNPCVTVSPLRSVNSSSKKSADRVKPPASVNKGKLSDKARPSTTLDKRKPSFGSQDGKLSSGSEKSRLQARRRSRNIQLTSLFDSLTRFFSADSDRRRRAAYVNATVSLAQSSLNPRHNFAGAQPWQQTVPPPVTPKSRHQPAKRPSPASNGAEVKTKVRRGRSTPAVKRPAKCDDVKDSVTKSLTQQLPIDGAEMKDLLVPPVAESESKLFHTAQTIAQQV